MICILRYASSPVETWVGTGPVRGELIGWIISTDVDDARRQAHMAGEKDLAELLYRLTFMPRPGRYDLGPEFVMLVT